MKKFLLSTISIISLISFSQVANACAGNDFACIQRQQQIAALHTDPAYCSYGYNPNCYPNNNQPRRSQEPVDLTPPAELMDRAEFAVALSPSTGAVGASSFAWKDSKTHYALMAGHDTFALASCIAKTQGQPISSITLEKAAKLVKKYGKKSDCQVVKESDPLDESLVAILRGKLANGQYQLFMATRQTNTYLFCQQQPEFKSLMASCQAKATNCEVVGQFGDKTELY